MRTVQQTDAYGLSRIGLQNRRIRIAVDKRAENMGGIVTDFQALGHWFTAVIDAHHTWIVIRTRMLGRIERVSILIKQQGKVVQKQRKLAVRLAVSRADYGFSAAFKLLACFWVEKDRA